MSGRNAGVVKVRPIGKLLVANRGEIACRVLRSAADLGMATVAVYGDEDRHALHVELADEAVHIGSEANGIPYLDMAAIIAAAERSGAGAVHPGYGFLAENHVFAQAVLDAGLTWVSPPPAVLAAMGDKDVAKTQAEAVGIPVIPGAGGRGADDATLIAAAEQMAMPVLIKAVAGGGGRGMRVVRHVSDLAGHMDLARREATQAFGDGALLVERYIEHGRHVEVQIFGDQQGHHLHLGERECSIQRRHQKLVEESPSPGIDDSLRRRLWADALRLVSAIGYVGAGTVEFLVDADRGEHHFLEVNARIQVEHPVTELVTGIDLVAWQLQVAEGQPLPLTQDQVQLRGHAIEVRLCAEDPSADHLPQAGPVHLWQPPSGVRVDTALRSQDRVSMHYDSMVAKLISWAPNRNGAIRKCAKALADTALLGLRSNRSFLVAVLAHPEFVGGATFTRFLAEHAIVAKGSADTPTEGADDDILLATALWRHGQSLQGRFRNNPWRGDITVLETPAGPRVVALSSQGGDRWTWGVAPHEDPLLQQPPALGGQVRVLDRSDHAIVLELEGHRRRYVMAADGAHIYAQRHGGPQVALVEGTLLPEPEAEQIDPGSVVAPSAAVVSAIHVSPGEMVVVDQPLLTLEAMKMLTELRSPSDGPIEAILCEPGQSVAAGQVLIGVEVR